MLSNIDKRYWFKNLIKFKNCENNTSNAMKNIKRCWLSLLRLVTDHFEVYASIKPFVIIPTTFIN